MGAAAVPARAGEVAAGARGRSEPSPARARTSWFPGRERAPRGGATRPGRTRSTPERDEERAAGAGGGHGSSGRTASAPGSPAFPEASGRAISSLVFGIEGSMRFAGAGCTGFLGGAIARAAIDAGMPSARSGGPRRDAPRSRIWPWSGCVRTALGRASLVQAMEGCEVRLPRRRPLPTVSLDRRATLRKGVLGMRHVLRAARTAGVRRPPLHSSLSTIGKAEPARSRPRKISTCRAPSADPTGSWKWRWRRVLPPRPPAGRTGDPQPDDVHTAPRREATSGSRSSTSRSAGSRLHGRGVERRRRARRGAGPVAAVERGRRGERYILGDHNVSVSMFFLHVARAAGVSPRACTSRERRARAALATELLAAVTRGPRSSRSRAST